VRTTTYARTGHCDGGRITLRRLQAAIQQSRAVAVLPRLVLELRSAHATAFGARVPRKQRQLDDQQ